MRLAVILSMAGLLGIPAFSYGQDSTKADNPKVNQRDRSKAEPSSAKDISSAGEKSVSTHGVEKERDYASNSRTDS